MRYVIGAALLIVAVLLVLFGVQNPQPVTVRFLWLVAQDLSLSLVIVIAAICGATLVGLVNLWGSVRRSVRGRRERKERTALEARALELEQKLAALEQENARLKPKPAVPEQPPAAATTTAKPS